MLHAVRTMMKGVAVTMALAVLVVFVGCSTHSGPTGPEEIVEPGPEIQILRFAIV